MTNPIATEAEYREDDIISKEHRRILKDFCKSVKIQDVDKAKEQIEVIKTLPWLVCKDGPRSLGVMNYQSRPWKARFLDQTELNISKTNEEVHPYLADFFDIAVRENMTRFDDWMLDDFKKAASFTNDTRPQFAKTPRYDGNYEIAYWLNGYALTSIIFEKQGKKLIEPKTFEEYPCLKQYVENEIEIRKFADLTKQVAEQKTDEGLKTLAGVVVKNLENPLKCEWFLKILDNRHLKEEVIEQSEILKLHRQNEAISKKLEETQARLEQMAQKASEKEVMFDRERETSVNVNEDLKGLTDEQRKQNFDQKKKLMEEHLIMTEACLNSMCTSYYLTEDKGLKDEMLSNLYDIRKGGEHNKDKRDMAKAFQRVLDRNPGLKKDENLVALSKIDTPFSQPTKRVQKQVTR